MFLWLRIVAFASLYFVFTTKSVFCDASRPHMFSWWPIPCGCCPCGVGPSHACVAFQNHRQSGEGFALAWSHMTAGLIASSGSDGIIDLWDTTAKSTDCCILYPTVSLRGHEGMLCAVFVTPALYRKIRTSVYLCVFIGSDLLVYSGLQRSCVFRPGTKQSNFPKTGCDHSVQLCAH